MRIHFLTALFLSVSTVLFAQKSYEVKSPDGKLDVRVQVGTDITYSLTHENNPVIKPSAISMKLGDGTVWGTAPKVISTQNNAINQTINSPFYKKKTVADQCNEMVLTFKGDFKIVFRAYNDGMAYRFVSLRKKDFTVTGEDATFNFDKDYKACVPYVKSKEKEVEKQFFNSFENTYANVSLSEMSNNRLAFTPLVVDLGNGTKVCLAESDLQGYPGMFLINKDKSTSLKGIFAPYPKTTVQGGYNSLQQIVTEPAPFIARCNGAKSFPWRIAIVTSQDKDLANNDMVYRLATPSKVQDISWIKPGKVAWDWWNNWGISNVDFEVGVNNQTYMAYIDFASRNHIDYVILDEGWAVNLKADLFQVVPEIDLEKLIAFGKSKNVGLILWAGYYAFERDMEKVCEHYSKMGIKGFKVDFMDRDDQQMVDFHCRAAAVAAKYKLLMDFHGTYKPTGLNRTYPNVINYEAVHGLEQMKWSDIRTDQVTYDVTMPFIRMVAGPVDYTQGAMTNGNKKTFAPINNAPMSQGTRCHQLAEYVVFESPLNMLCDSPTKYEKEQECTNFISAVPTVWDRTIALNGEVGQYITIARQKGDVWYVGSLTNWDERGLDIDLSFLGEGNFVAEIFKDGVNANRTASDYKRELITIPSNKKMSFKMAKGGGFAMRIYKK
ncbi:glycoside hydrolase family 97 protein [Parabacteroides sp. FAFU027]|uniref:glycoside hydrolase family 97 protein n=1 Tax=Parabacteroides sp. FAFU027 TaxID=2922715 RepID=UPI001FAFFF99|nr:glycoside hydrolase family 97 protein [Parabacteroides sp. FAFU027]